jgi:hypothetical protein
MNEQPCSTMTVPPLLTAMPIAPPPPCIKDGGAIGITIFAAKMQFVKLAVLGERTHTHRSSSGGGCHPMHYFQRMCRL